MAAFILDPLSLGPVTLAPLVETDAPAIVEAASEPSIWRFTPLIGGSPEAYVADALAARAASHVPFVVRLDGRVVGMSRCFDIDTVKGNFEIGYTWYHPDVWAGIVNPAAKRLLLAHGFETCGFERIQFKVDILNERSQAAVLKLGATREGVLRHERPRPDGSWRDTVVFSILREEWPAVRDGLDRRIANLS
ncbi:MAG: GNAT family N-acetyltransferase [Hyphomicrobiaceae bacterium]|nr:GNAT family N-acetyltransferase [Hyphomicrobiaceae bacterium]